ncbi:molybdate ABC transporter substrate-binding protein [Myxacorys almedinensis]|uniref:Molybdate ABC transporter substrate-binding protein n=1 Tax=Myxacorys almedinensis A TaxID=2690445 RepID=A0A8J7ZBI1_9CYAN|nr:molybdate ABC transporter substrate-binding protein [Myxacorys almedinensis]NDJ18915.1 molybdate ABC transporter substrate-binding protein [Myxacorys almedinensis A]
MNVKIDTSLVATLLTALLAIFLSGCTKQEASPWVTNSQPATLTVSAAISLREPLQEIGQLYERDRAVNVTYNFGSSGSLQQQIEQGAPVDVYLSAGSKQMDALQNQHLLQPNTRKALLTNRLVVIIPKPDRTSSISAIADLTRPEITRIALGEPGSVPAGQYAAEVLQHYNIARQLLPKLIYAKDVRQVLTYVETGNVDAGLVYLTDATSSQQVTIVAIAPTESHSKIVYPIALLKQSKNAAAPNFQAFVFSEPAKRIFSKYGFTTLGFSTSK